MKKIHKDYFIMLDKQERAVLLSIIEGRSVKQIAKDFGFSLKTAELEIQKIYAKINVRNQQEAMAMSFSQSLKYNFV